MAGWEVYNNTVIDADVGVLIAGGQRNHIKWNNFSQCDVGVHVDDRGEWPGVWGGQDISLILKAMHYAGAGRWRDAPWAVRYPSLPNVMSEHPAWPEFNEILWNDFSDRVGLALGGQSNHPTYPSNMTVATLQRYHSVFAENVLPTAGTHKPETRPGGSEEPGQRARETQEKREAGKPAASCAGEVRNFD